MAVSIGRPGFAHASKELLRETILDTVGALVAERRWETISLAEVAAGAGVSRQTLYNEFGSRGELARAYVMREAERLAGLVEGAITAGVDDPKGALSAALRAFLEAAADHPAIRAVAAGEGGSELLVLITSRGGPLLEAMSARIAAIVERTWEGVPPGDAQIIGELLVRLAISHAVRPTGDPATAADDVARALGPYLEGLLSELRA